jgi:hypothetical protein
MGIKDAVVRYYGRGKGGKPSVDVRQTKLLGMSADMTTRTDQGDRIQISIRTVCAYTSVRG